MAKTRKIPLRKSVVSNEVIDKRDLLRIVKNKEGQVFIDPTGKANGRGAYIKLDNQEALQAKKKRVFNRSFSMEVDEAFYDELIAYVDHKVKRRERAGRIISGEELTVKAIQEGKAHLVFLAQDAAPNLSKKITDKSRYYQVEVSTVFSTLELSSAIGKARKVLAVTDAGFTKKMRSLM